MKTHITLLTLAVASLSALAADITGTWKAVFETQRGLQKYTFSLKQDGANVTGFGACGTPAVPGGCPPRQLGCAPTACGPRPEHAATMAIASTRQEAARRINENLTGRRGQRCSAGPTVPHPLGSRIVPAPEITCMSPTVGEVFQ